MSQEMEAYGAAAGAPQNLRAFARRDCARLAHDRKYQPPTPEEISALIRLAGWSQVETAKIVGVAYKAGKGSTTVRKWRAPEKSPEHRAIPYAAWRLMLAAAGVVTISPDQFSPERLRQVAE